MAPPCSPYPAFGIDQNLGHDEQRDAAHACRQLAAVVGHLGQHQVDDVLAHRMLAAGDPHLAARQPVARAQRVVGMVGAIGHGTRRDVRQAGAGLRLAEVHRAKKAALQLRQRKGLLLRGRAMGHQQAGIGRCQHRIGLQGNAGRRDHAVGRHLHHAGQLHASHLVVVRRRQHARFGIGSACRRCAVGQMQLLPVKMRLLLVDQAVEGLELVGGQALAHVQHRAIGLAVVPGIARMAAERFYV